MEHLGFCTLPSHESQREDLSLTITHAKRRSAERFTVRGRVTPQEALYAVLPGIAIKIRERTSGTVRYGFSEFFTFSAIWRALAFTCSSSSVRMRRPRNSSRPSTMTFSTSEAFSA